MKRFPRTPGRLLALIPLFLASVGCAYSGRSYPVLNVDSHQEIVFSYKYRELVLIRADGGAAEGLVSSDEVMITPRFSPDGEKLAYYDVGTRRLPVSSTVVTLHILWLDGNADADFDLLSVPIEQFNLDNKLVVDNVVPPLWEPEGASVLIAHNRGIDRLSVDGGHIERVGEGKVRSITLSPDGRDIVFSDGQNIYFLDRRGGSPRRVLDDGFVPPFTNRYIRGLAFSPQGDRLTFGMGGGLYALDVGTGNVRMIFETTYAIYWSAWVSGSERIVILSGRERRLSRITQALGEFRLESVTADGEGYMRLFSNPTMDVREASPDLSPDGRYVTVTSKPIGYAREIFLIGAQGEGVRRLTVDGPNSFAAWRPLSARPFFPE